MIGVGSPLEKRSPLTAKALEIMPSIGTYLQWHSFLDKSQWWSKGEIESYQFQQLSNLLNHAYQNVPYYQRVFEERGLKPEDFQRIEDLNKLPFLTKDIIRRNLDSLIAKNHQKQDLEYVTTGGSSGVPLGFYYEKSKTRAIEWAFIKNIWERVGFGFSNKCAIFRGTAFENGRNQYSKRILLGRWMVCSSFRLSSATFQDYARDLQGFKPKYIQAFPSVASVLAHHWKKNGTAKIKGLRAILCSSETLLPAQREYLEEALGARAFSWYGQSERVILAGECETERRYHISPEYGIFETVDPNDHSNRNASEGGLIIGTSLTSFAMPLIRYTTDDICTMGGQKCKCGRNHQIITSVEGRLQEMLVGKQGERVPTAALNMHSKTFDNVVQFQYVQDEKGKLRLNLIKDEGYSSEDEREIKKAFQEKLGEAFQIEISYVDEIEKTKRGKTNLVIQNLESNESGGE